MRKLFVFNEYGGTWAKFWLLPTVAVYLAPFSFYLRVGEIRLWRNPEGLRLTCTWRAAFWPQEDRRG